MKNEDRLERETKEDLGFVQILSFVWLQPALWPNIFLWLSTTLFHGRVSQ